MVRNIKRKIVLSDQADNYIVTGFGDMIWDPMTNQTWFIDFKILGGGGADTISTGRGNDFIDGQDGNDQLSGGSGDDMLSGGNGNDTLNGGFGNDHLDGGDGVDLAYYFEVGYENGSNVEIWADNLIDLQAGTATSTITGPSGTVLHQFQDTLIRIENIWSGHGNDTILGSSEDNELNSGRGNDVVNGRGGNDRIFTEEGDDVASGGAGDDLIDSGDGRDLVDGGDGNDEISGGDGADTLLGGSGDDLISGGTGFDNISGGSGSDTVSYHYVTESTEHDLDDAGVIVDLSKGKAIYLGSDSTGNNVARNLDKLSGIENVEGSELNDVLVGDRNANTLDGNYGSDVLLGGQGADKFEFGRYYAGDRDTVSDFEAGADLIALELAYGNQKLNVSVVQDGKDAVITATEWGRDYAVTIEDATVGQVADAIVWI